MILKQAILACFSYPQNLAYYIIYMKAQRKGNINEKRKNI